MSSRKNTNVTTSQNGVSFAAGSASVQTTVQNQDVSLQGTLTAYNGHAAEIWGDRSVFDTVTGAFLFPGRDYDPAAIQRK